MLLEAADNVENQIRVAAEFADPGDREFLLQVGVLLPSRDSLIAAEVLAPRLRLLANATGTDEVRSLAPTMNEEDLAILDAAARLCYDHAHYAAELIDRLPGYDLLHPEAAFFQEFVIRCPRPVSQISASLRESAIVGGLDVSTDGEPRMLLCCSETNTRTEIEALAGALSRAGAAS